MFGIERQLRKNAEERLEKVREILLGNFEKLKEDRSDESITELARNVSSILTNIRKERDRLKKNLDNARKGSGKEDLEEQVANAREFLRIANGELHNHQKSLEELASEAAEKLKSSKKKNEYIESIKREVHDMSMNVNDLQEELGKEREEKHNLRKCLIELEKHTGKFVHYTSGKDGEPTKVFIEDNEKGPTEETVRMNVGHLVSELNLNAENRFQDLQDRIKESLIKSLETAHRNLHSSVPPAKAHHRDGIYIGKARIRSIELQGARNFMEMNQRKGGSYDYSENLSPDSEGKACGTRPPIGALDLLKDCIEQGDRVKAVNLKKGMEEPAFSNCKTGEIYGIVEEAIRNADLDEENDPVAESGAKGVLVRGRKVRRIVLRKDDKDEKREVKIVEETPSSRNYIVRSFSQLEDKKVQIDKKMRPDQLIQHVDNLLIEGMSVKEYTADADPPTDGGPPQVDTGEELERAFTRACR